MEKILNQNYYGLRADAAKEVADLVASTAGPYGSNVDIHTPNGLLMIRDGYKVLEQFNPKPGIIRAVAWRMMGAAHRTANSAGDGTTTTTVLISKIFNWLKNDITTGSSREIARGIRQAANDAAFLLDSGTIDLDLSKDSGKKTLRHAATLAGGNDPVIGNNIADMLIAIGEDGHISVEWSDDIQQVDHQIKDGYRTHHGLVHKDLLPTGRMGIKLKDALVVLVNDPINTKAQANNVIKVWREYCRTENKVVPMILFCAHIDADAKSMMLHRTDVMTGDAVQAPWYTVVVNTVNAWDDLAAVTGAKVISSRHGRGAGRMSVDDCAIVDGISLSMTETIVEVNPDKLKESGLIDRLKETMQDTDEEQRDVTRKRIAQLEGRVGVIRVPRSTQAKASWYIEVIEDAVRAAKDAIKNGVSAGAGRTLIDVSVRMEALLEDNNLSESFKLGYMAVVESLYAITERLLQNGGVSDGMIGEVIETMKSDTNSHNTINLSADALPALLAGGEDWGKFYGPCTENGVLDATGALISAVSASCNEVADWVETKYAAIPENYG